MSGLLFQSTLSVRRATSFWYKDFDSMANFNPRSPWGERLFVMHAVASTLTISIHALREESDCSKPKFSHKREISIHALREESDFKWISNKNLSKAFQSTLSVRRATFIFGTINKCVTTFQSTLSVRRATFLFYAWFNGCNISIHALREESDAT